MVKQSTRSSFPAGNPIANVLVLIVGVVTIAVSVVLGFFAFVALAAIVFVAAAVIGLRAWWLNARMRRDGGIKRRQGRRDASPDVIEGEYRVIREDRDKP